MAQSGLALVTDRARRDGMDGGPRIRYMAYIDVIVEVLRTAPGPLTTHQIADAIDRGTVPVDRRPSEATITTWLYAMTGHSHDHPEIHRVDAASSGQGCICWACDAASARGGALH